MARVSGGSFDKFLYVLIIPVVRSYMSFELCRET